MSFFSSGSQQRLPLGPSEVELVLRQHGRRSSRHPPAGVLQQGPVVSLGWEADHGVSTAAVTVEIIPEVKSKTKEGRGGKRREGGCGRLGSSAPPVAAPG